MWKLGSTYDAIEEAWITEELTLKRDIYLMISLEKKGKLVIRQETEDGRHPRIPLERHKDTKDFALRISVVPEEVKIQIFTSTKPKEIKYAYI